MMTAGRRPWLWLCCYWFTMVLGQCMYGQHLDWEHSFLGVKLVLVECAKSGEGPGVVGRSGRGGVVGVVGDVD